MSAGSVVGMMPPSVPLLVAALLVPFLRGRWRAAVMLAAPLVGLAYLASLELGTSVTASIFGLDLELVRVDRLSRLFGVIFHLAAFVNVLYGLHVRDPLQHVASLVYAAGAIGATFAGDLITLFVCWELLGLASVFLIWARRTERAARAGMRYLVSQLTSGVLLLAGTVFLYSETGSIAFGFLGDGEGGIGGLGSHLVFLAFGIKAAFPLLHMWMEDTYPEATVTGTVWLSSFTTKVAIYALARAFPGTEILIPIGVTMAAFPIFFAVIENDLRRVLCYSMNNQLGFMVVGVGVGTKLGIDGATAHVFADVLFKGLLFMSMGAVLHRVHTVNGSELGGLYKSMPWTTAFCIVGASSISAFPLFSAFVTKSIILTAVAEEHHTIAFLILLFASAGVFHHSGIKIPFFAFFAHDSGKRCDEAPLNMLLAMGIAAALCIGIGVWYQPLYALLPHPEVLGPGGFTPYDVSHVVTQLQLLLFSFGAFVFLQKTGLYPPELRSVNLEVDVIYRKLLPGGARRLRVRWPYAELALREGTLERVTAIIEQIRRLHAPGVGVFGEPWPSGRTAFWAATFLVLALVVYYL